MFDQEAWRGPAKAAAACTLLVGFTVVLVHLQGRARAYLLPVRGCGEQQQRNSSAAVEGDPRCGTSSSTVGDISAGAGADGTTLRTANRDAPQESADRALTAAGGSAAETGRGAAPQAVPPRVAPEPRSCQVDLSGSPFVKYCVPLPRVCVDQGDIILHDARYQQVSSSPLRMPGWGPPVPH